MNSSLRTDVELGFSPESIILFPALSMKIEICAVCEPIAAVVFAADPPPPPELLDELLDEEELEHEVLPVMTTDDAAELLPSANVIVLVLVKHVA